jgi:hypothetical protein
MTTVMPDAAASGDANMGPANVHMGSPSAEVSAAEVAPTKVTAASVSATSMTASTTSKGNCRDCRTTQKDSGDRYEQCFSQHQDLHHSVSMSKLAIVFPVHRRGSSGQMLVYASYDNCNEEIERERFER